MQALNHTLVHTCTVMAEKPPPPTVRKNIPLKGEPARIKSDPDPDYDDISDTSLTSRYHYFLYGALMDPTTLARALKLRDSGPPGGVLRPARIVGRYDTCMLWGEYPALLVVDGNCGHDHGPRGTGTGSGFSCACTCSKEVEVHGMAYEVQRSPTEERRRPDRVRDGEVSAGAVCDF